MGIDEWQWHTEGKRILIKQILVKSINIPPFNKKTDTFLIKSEIIEKFSESQFNYRSTEKFLDSIKI